MDGAAALTVEPSTVPGSALGAQDQALLSDMESSSLQEITEALVSERKDQGVSQTEVAKRCGWSRQYQSKLEKGNPTLPTLEKFAEALGMTIRVRLTLEKI